MILRMIFDDTEEAKEMIQATSDMLKEIGDGCWTARPADAASLTPHEA